MRRSTPEEANACASVLATMNSAPVSPAAIILLTALPPAPPTPITTMRGFMIVSPSKALLEPLSHPLQVALRRSADAATFHADIGIERDVRQSNRGGKRRTAERRGHPRKRRGLG